METEDDLLDSLEDSWEQVKAQKFENKPYFAPSDEPLSWETKGKVVRLDVAIMALHLAHARANTRSLASRVHERTAKLREQAATWFGVQAVKYGIKELIGIVLNRILYVVNLFRFIDFQQGVEKDIRRAAIRSLREAYNLCLPKKRKVRKTKAVSTRHESPRQRRPNKSWRSPRSK